MQSSLETHITILEEEGKEKLYRRVLGDIIIHYDNEFPEEILLEKSEKYFASFRRTGEEKFFETGKILRRAAHKLYRERRRTFENYPTLVKFLDIVRK